jgi:peroxiredoxin
MRNRPSIQAVTLLCLFNAATAFAQQNPDGRLPVAQAAEPYLFLIRDPLVHRELRLTAAQRRAVASLNDRLDGPLWTTRNRQSEEADRIIRRLLDEARTAVAEILTAAQQRRLQQIRLQTLGTRSLLTGEVADGLDLSEDQSTEIREIIEETGQAVKALEKRAQDGEPLSPLEREHKELRRAEHTRILAVLRPAQQNGWAALLGDRADLAELGRVKFLAPELAAEAEWLNSPPLTVEQLRGKVVALHFWTFGCINCIHNYPSYKNWLREFEGKGFVMLGVHTPEGRHEHEVSSVRTKAADNGLTFPIVIDNEKAVWNSWGNSMWPSVYLIDKQGYVRYWWFGELNWQGAKGEELLGQRIAELLAE